MRTPTSTLADFAPKWRGLAVVSDREGAPMFGYRIWPEYRDERVVGAMLDGLTDNDCRAEKYSILVVPDAEPGRIDAPAEAWRTSDRTLAMVAPLHAIAARLADLHQPMTRS
jgi:hypothetical protein